MELKKIQENGIEATRYLERYVNNIKGDHEVYSDTLPIYSPHEGIDYFPAPVFNLPREVVNIIQADPDPRLLCEIIGADVKFVIHPNMLEDQEYLDRTGLSEYTSEQSYIVSPTSSTRTLLTHDQPYTFMVKTDLEKRHYKFIRRLKGTSVEHSIAMSSELGSICKDEALSEFAYLPESIGIIFGDEKTGAGVLFREIVPRPLVDDTRTLVPYFSLYANDIRNPEDRALLSQLIDLHSTKGQELAYFTEVILGKIIRNWTTLARDYGILPELHGQNTLLELNDNLEPERIVYRDFQGTYVDAKIREEKGLKLPFTKHLAGEESGTDRAKQFSHIYDHNVGHLLLERLTNTFIRDYPQYKYEQVTSEVATMFNSLFPEAKDIFPKETYKVGKVVNNEVVMEKTHDNPMFR